MNILLAGAGSIGTRHLNNLFSLGCSDITVVNHNKKIVKHQPCKQLLSFGEIEKGFYDAAIVCTPTSMHIDHTKTLIRSDIPRIYLEKPVGNNYKKALELKEDIDQKNVFIKVGYDLRYDLGLQKVKELISTGAIGRIISVNAFVGQYLPDWRPSQDYKKSMSAKKDAGGGVLLDLAHEFDYLYWLLGEVDTIACNYNNTGTLEIETEEVAEVLLKFKSGVIGTIHLDYLQPQLVRNCRITGSEGMIYWNLVESKVTMINYLKEEIVFDYKGFERNDRFIKSMNDFLQGVNDDRTVGYNEGLESLKLTEAAKFSSENNVFVKLDSFVG